MKISVYVTDAASGVPVGELPARLARWTSGRWDEVWSGRTDADGRLIDLSIPDHAGAVFELTLQTDPYYTTLGLAPFFTNIRIAFNGDEADRYIPIVLAPQAYMLCAVAQQSADDRARVARPISDLGGAY